jgi:hypothetical protein
MTIVNRKRTPSAMSNNDENICELCKMDVLKYGDNYEFATTIGHDEDNHMFAHLVCNCIVFNL